MTNPPEHLTNLQQRFSPALKKHLSSLESLISSLDQDTANVVSEQLLDVQKRLHLAEQKTRALLQAETQLRLHQAQNEHLEEFIQKTEDNILECHAQVEGAKTKSFDLQKKLLHTQEQKQTLTKTVEKTKKSIEKTKQDISLLLSQKDSMQKEIAILDRKQDSLRQQIEGMRSLKERGLLSIMHLTEDLRKVSTGEE